MPSDLLKGGNGRFCSRQVSTSGASRRSAPKLALSTIEFQHILLLTSTGLLMEGLMLSVVQISFNDKELADETGCSSPFVKNRS
jgi:hypothetical protein